MLYSDMTLIAVIAGVIIPILVGLVTKLQASPSVKAVLNFGLTAAAGLLVTVNEATFEWKVFLVNWSLTWAVSVATYYGLYKPSGISDTVQEKTADIGIG